MAGTRPGHARSLCDTGHGVEVCVDRGEYRSGGNIVITTRNLTDRPIFKDGCATATARVPESEDDHRPRYTPRRNCGINATIADILAHAVRMEAGALLEENLQLGYGPQDFYRVQMWLLTPRGELAFRTPVNSGQFVIFPAASN